MRLPDFLRPGRGRPRHEGGGSHDRNGLPGEFLDVPQIRPFIARTERNRNTAGARTSRAADAVDVAFGLVRKVEVHDMGDVGHVDTACSDIGRDQHPDLAVAEPLEGAFALRLGLVAVDGI